MSQQDGLTILDFSPKRLPLRCLVIQILTISRDSQLIKLFSFFSNLKEVLVEFFVALFCQEVIPVLQQFFEFFLSLFQPDYTGEGIQHFDAEQAFLELTRPILCAHVRRLWQKLGHVVDDSVAIKNAVELV